MREMVLRKGVEVNFLLKEPVLKNKDHWNFAIISAVCLYSFRTSETTLAFLLVIGQETSIALYIDIGIL